MLMVSKSTCKQLAESAALAQPAIGSAFRAGRGHAADDRANRGGALPTVESQTLQQRDQPHLFHGPQGDLFDANAAWSQQLQGSYIDAVEHALGSAAGRFGRDRSESYLAGEQLRGDALCFRLDRGSDRGRDQGLLAAQELFEADTEQRPVGLRDGEVAPEIEQGTLADASADTFGMDQPKGEVAVAAGGGAGLGATHEHGLRGRYGVV